jgi:hypothetical protein
MARFVVAIMVSGQTAVAKASINRENGSGAQAGAGLPLLMVLEGAFVEGG